MSHEPIRFGYRTLIIALMSAFGAGALYWTRGDSQAVSDVLWTMGVVYIAVIGRSALPLVRPKKDVEL